jgi:hypothetical protein
MATIKQFIDECETVANAQVGLQSFIFEDAFSVDAHRGKDYPLLLIERSIQVNNLNIQTGLRIYTIKFTFYQIYTREQEKNTPDQDKLTEVENIAVAFFKKVRERAGRVGVHANQWEITPEISPGQNFFNKANDRLIQLTFDVEVKLEGNCPTITFNF